MQDRPEDVPAQAHAQPSPPPGSAAEPAHTPTPEGGSQAYPAQSPRPDSAPGNPYQVPQQANAYGPPPGYPPAQHYPYAPPPGFSPPPGGGGAGRAVLWAAVGAVAASVLWAGGIHLLGPLGGDPDLGGYRARANLCSSVDYTALRTEYAEKDSAPTHNSLKHKALDQSYCSISLKRTTSSAYSDAYLSVQMDLHKETDPSAEFTALWSEYNQRYDDYEVEKVSGFGDEAYLVTEDTTSGSGTSGSRAVILAVRDGWMTYQMSWSVYTTSYGTTSPPDIEDVSRWVKTDTRSTLEDLRSG
ncbi:hypothetical protein [Streptomyces fructofermentans]|uniref:Uncharacterized protein n=1 Tax=Streptomyces fructofermentans TaxID=152141 RepID=A0A918KEH2_9ACTN|nr:hypothetical protein [Streptomyces fructofermentans]GGX58385.1 hypothetical protein GCM10010515_27460 [Streptomyces fructofermentans]